MNPSASAHSLPLVSVILPIRNEAASIAGCLKRVLEQDYPHDRLEVIVVDGVSTDNTLAVLDVLKQSHGNLFVYTNSGQIVPTGLNLGIRHAKGEIIVRVDGHTDIAPDYVRRCVEALTTTGADNAGGRMNAVGATPFGQTVAVATSTPFGIGNSRFHYSDREEWVDSVYMGAWPRRVFHKIGLFDEELVRDQDDEFNYRLREHGGKIWLSPKIHSTYTVRGDPTRLWRQYYQYGYWKVRVLQKHPRQMSLRQFVPPAFVAALLVSGVLAAFHPAGLALLALVAGSYLLANLGASFLTAARQGWRHLPLLPLVFAFLHLSYGSGFLVGLVKFAHRWGDKVGKTPRARNSMES